MVKRPGKTYKKTLKKYGKKLHKRLNRKQHRKEQLLSSTGGTTYYLNTKLPKIYSVQKSVIEALQWVGNGGNVQNALIFDPFQRAGMSQTGTASGAILPTSPAGLWSAIPEYQSFQALFDRYKVKKITVKLTADMNTAGTTTSSLLFNGFTAYMRYNNDLNLTAGQSLTQISKMRDVKVHTFTPEHPSIEYSIYPKCLYAADFPANYSGTVSSLGNIVKNCPWVDVDWSVPLYGFLMTIYGLPTGVVLNMDIQYDIKFKEQV